MRRVAITRAAALSPRGWLRPQSGFAHPPRPAGAITRFPADDFPARTARELDTPSQDALASLVLRETFPGGVPGGYAPERCGLYLGAEPERVQVAELSAVNRAVREGLPLVDADAVPHGAYARRSPGGLAARMAATLGLSGPRRVYAMACAASAAAAAGAWRALQTGEIEAALCAGVASNVEPMLFAGFCLLGAMSPSGQCRPFDLQRDGFVLADGAGALWLEDEARVLAQGRAGEIEGYLLGAGESMDAHRMTDPEPSGAGAQAAIRAALAAARVAPDEVALVKGHATGTWRNDAAESSALAALLPHRPPILALKGGIGHSIAACGVVELIAALHALRSRAVEGAYGLAQLDPALPAPNVTPYEEGPRPLRPGVALCNTFGFGGINCALVVAGPPDLP